MEHRNTHLIVLYVLVAILAAWLLYAQIVQQAPQSAGTWQCSNVACAEYAGPDVWVQQNCFLAPDENGTQTPVCRVTVNGATQVVPLNVLNLTNARQCVKYTCLQEVNVRAVNYTLNVSQVPQ